VTPPLFMFPPVTGDTSCYVEVSAEITDRPVYMLHAVHADDSPRTVEALASRYLTDITTMADGAPLLLFGWSAGGLLAFEAARQARLAGVSIAGVALLEVRAPIDVMIDAVPGGLTELSTILPLARRLAYLVEAEPASTQAEITAMSPEQRIEAVHREAIRTGYLRPDASVLDTRRLIATFQWLGHAAMTYRPTPYAGRLTLFEVTSSLPAHPRPATLGWEPFASEIESIRVEGNVFSVLHPSRRKAFGQALLAWAQSR
jgi:phthiocerol/phenolphthiocerol synthesis type-I polyketide synthase D